jgi:hypothetical protein
MEVELHLIVVDAVNNQADRLNHNRLVLWPDGDDLGVDSVELRSMLLHHVHRRREIRRRQTRVGMNEDVDDTAALLPHHQG